MDVAEKNVKETVEKCVCVFRFLSMCSATTRWGADLDLSCVDRLRQVDVKAEHFERQVQRVEQERDEWEKKYEVRGIACPQSPFLIRWLIRFCIARSYRTHN